WQRPSVRLSLALSSNCQPARPCRSNSRAASALSVSMSTSVLPHQQGAVDYRPGLAEPAGPSAPNRSILLGQEQRRVAPAGLGDEPQAFPEPGRVAAEDAAPFPQGDAVRLAVVAVHVSPITRAVAPQEVGGDLPGAAQGTKRPRRGDDLTQREQRHG